VIRARDGAPIRARLAHSMDSQPWVTVPALAIATGPTTPRLVDLLGPEASPGGDPSRFCRRSAQQVRTEPYWIGSARMTRSASTLLNRADTAQANHLGRSWMSLTRLKPQGRRFGPVPTHQVVRLGDLRPGTLPGGRGRPSNANGPGRLRPAGTAVRRCQRCWRRAVISSSLVIEARPSMPSSLARSCSSSTVRSS